MDPEQFNIIHKEINSHSRTIKEVMFIHVQDPTLNRNLGMYQLLHIWDHLLQASPTLQCMLSRHPLHPPKPPYQFLLLLVPLSAGHIGGGHILFLLSTHARSNTTPNTPKTPQMSQKLHPLQQCHFGKFLILFVSLTFL